MNFRQFKHLTEVSNLRRQSCYMSYTVSTADVPIWEVTLMPDGQNHLTQCFSPSVNYGKKAKEVIFPTVGTQVPETIQDDSDSKKFRRSGPK